MTLFSHLCLSLLTIFVMPGISCQHHRSAVWCSKKYSCSYLLIADVVCWSADKCRAMWWDVLQFLTIH